MGYNAGLKGTRVYNEIPKPIADEAWSAKDVWWHAPSDSWIPTPGPATTPLIIKSAQTGNVYGRKHDKIYGWQWIKMDNPDDRLKQGELF